MKVLWLCNEATPKMAKALNIRSAVTVSWLVGASEKIKGKVQLIMCTTTESISEIQRNRYEDIKYIAVPRRVGTHIKFDNKLESQFLTVLDAEKPDVVHIWGTEFPQTYSMMLACEKYGVLDCTYISIQGFISIIAKHYLTGLPEWVVRSYSFRDLLKRNNLLLQQKSFFRRGKYERLSIKKARHVIGRTDWDQACVKQCNPEINYHYNNETLRNEFYVRKDKEKQETHRIFMSQAGYPVKGFHYAIEALAILKKQYSDVHLYVTGTDIIRDRSVKTVLRQTYYVKYCRRLLIKYGVCDNITFLGTLDASAMYEQYEKASVYILPSVIENSPNSLGEAMLVGTPVVAADVGGVKNMIRHETEGFLYQHDAPYMLAFYVDKIFKWENEHNPDYDMLQNMIEKAQKHALETHDPEQNAGQLLKIYKKEDK